jgi:carboxyl-terminal processing protease
MKKIFSILFFLLLVTSASAKKDEKTDANQSFNAMKHIEVYNSVLRELEINYVDTLQHDKLLKQSLDRMLYALDPYTSFIPSSDEETLKRLRSGQYGGIGSVITLVDGKPYLSDPYYGMPAQVNGLCAGDEIVEIDGVKCEGKSISEVSDMLRGKPHTEITIKIRRYGDAKIIKKSFLRDIIQMPTVPFYAQVEDGVGYIVVLDFIDRTAADFEKALKDLVSQHNINKLIIDLRGNGGGLVGQAVEIASLFLPRGTEIVSMKGRHNSTSTVYKTHREPLYPNMQLLFLVDGNTASSSEILSGAMQDLDRAYVLGERTFGKGLVQNVRELPFDNYLKVTTAKYYLPSGRCIQAVDYANRQNGTTRVIPDSLTKEFRTLKGRIVRDGGGVTPDSIISEEATYNIAGYLYLKNLYFKYANQYVASHPAIAPASQFQLTDDEYNDFCKFVIQSGFTYRLESEKYLQDLKKMVKTEGYDTKTDSLFTQLTNLLQPNVADDLTLFRNDVQEMLEMEIIKRYYYQKGTIEYSLRHDDWLKTAISIIQKNIDEIK